MLRVKNQHYVPQFYLKRFSQDDRTLFAFDKVNKKSFQTNVSNVAGEQRFYDLPPGPDVQAVEKGFSVLEAGYAEAVQSLLNEVGQEGRFDAGLSERNRGVAHFLATQFCRTREFRDTHARMLEGLSKAVSEKHEFVRQHMAAHGEVVEVEPPIMPVPSELAPLEQAYFMFCGTFVERIMPALLGHIWLVAENRTSHPLYTSDAPVVLYPHVDDPLYGGSGFASRGIEILFPLSFRFMLVLRERSHFKRYTHNLDGDVMQLRPEGVSLYNSLQIANSCRQIYCSEDRFDQVSELMDKFPELGDQGRPRFSING